MHAGTAISLVSNGNSDYVSSKIRYLTMELFGDLAPYMFGTFEFYATLFLFLFAFWIRIYVHYLAQYLYLQVRRCIEQINLRT